MSRCRFVLRLLMTIPGVLAFYSPLLIGLSLIGIAIPFVTGRFINALVYRESWLGPFVILGVAFLSKALLTPFLQRYVCSRSRTLETNLQFRVLNSVMNFHPAKLATLESGELVAKLTRDTYAIGGFVRGLYPQMLQASVLMVAAGCALYSRSALLSIAFIATFPISILLFIPYARKFSATSHQVREKSDLSFNALFDFLQALPFLRVLDAERRFFDEPSLALSGLKDSNVKSDSVSIRFGFLLGLLLACGEGAVLGVAGTFAAKGKIPVGDVVVYQMLFVTAIQSVQGVIGLLPQLAALREGVSSLQNVLGGFVTDKLGNIITKRKGQRLGKFESLTFDGVSFAYPQRMNRLVVAGVSETFGPGMVVGFEGANGSGKTTLLKLAVNALEPQSGQILFNGCALSEIDLAAFRRRIGIVFQDNPIVAGSIRDNITLRDSMFTDKDVAEAIRLSGFDEVVKCLPAGLNTHIDNRSCKLSGGERQRLALARALIRDPMILILDEATNHLDAVSRKSLVALIGQIRRERLILIAGHDPELTQLCDRHISLQRTGVLCT